MAALRPWEPRTLYVWTVAATGTLVIYDAFRQLSLHPIGYQWLVLAALAVVGSLTAVAIRSMNATISMSETFVFTAVLLFGRAAGTLTVALDGLITYLWLSRRRFDVHYLAFNATAPALSLWVSARVVERLGGFALRQSPDHGLNAVWAVFAFACLYYALNSWLVSFGVALERRVSPYRVWREGFTWISVNYVAGAALALLLVGDSVALDGTRLAIIVLLLSAFYVAFRGALGRSEDAIHHLEQLNRLHLATIETLAAAVDAKDQTTHGHLRRVQQLAVRLAQAVGVVESDQIKAIEAASLLHDLGKLAVPDYILNKPGRLTAAEFEKIKRHAAAGADILSAIDFPYPVVPIVRHHHENWDGTGYPDGLAGHDIPIGARILSVVDCFDALTTDRPYRRRLAPADALSFIAERRGVMYDPRVVDGFLGLHLESSDTSEATALEDARLQTIRHSARAARADGSAGAVDADVPSAKDVAAVFALGRRLGAVATLADAGAALTEVVSAVAPASLVVFYAFDRTRDELVVAAASGDGSGRIAGSRLSLGHGLSGWVGANRQGMLNGNPALDLDENAEALGLRSCLSVPVTSNDELVGVLTLHAGPRRAFTDEHLVAVRLVAAVGAESLRALATTQA